MDAEYIARIKRRGGIEGLREQYSNRLERAKLMLNPKDPTPFHAMRAECVRLLITEAEILSREIAQAEL